MLRARPARTVRVQLGPVVLDEEPQRTRLVTTLDQRGGHVANIQVFGPWDAGTIPPGEVWTSVWKFDPEPDVFTYQVTGRSKQTGKTQIKVVETSLEYTKIDPNFHIYQATIHVALQNLGDHPAACQVVISVISP